MTENADDTEQGNTESAADGAQAGAADTPEQQTLLGGDGGDAGADAGGNGDASDADGGDGDGGEGGEQQGAPEAYEDFTLPEGMEMDSASLEKASELFKGANLNQEQAQQFVDLMAEKVAADAQAAEEQHKATVQQWLSDAKGDSDMGGAKWAATETAALKAMDKFGSPELKEFMNTTGLGNHPEMIRMLARVGQTTSEPGLDGGQGGQQSEAQARANRWQPQL